MPNSLTFLLICLIIRRKEGENMRNFDYSDLASRSWDSEIIGLVTQIHEYKGRQELYLKQKPTELDHYIVYICILAYISLCLFQIFTLHNT